MKRMGLLVLLITLAALSLLLPDSWLSLGALQQHHAQWQAWVDAHFITAAGTFFLLYVVSTALSLPWASLLTLAGGALFGWIPGIIMVSLASTLGASLSFLAARYVLRDWVSQRFAKAVTRINQGLASDGVAYLLTLRLVPLFPFFLVNLLLGLTRLPLLTYAWASWLGMLPATFVYVLAGRELGQLTSTGDILSPGLLLGLSLLALLPWAGKLMARTLRRPPPSHQTPTAPSDNKE